MFKRLNINDDRKAIDVFIDGLQVSCYEGDTVAAAILVQQDKPYRRSILSGEERAPYCMMGICFECLVEINGIPNQQGCLRKIEPGMRIVRQLQAESGSWIRDTHP